MGIVISLANQKGGVAKTTSCVNIGAGLAMRDYKTLLIDFDPQASLSRYLGLPDKGPAVEDWVMEKELFKNVVSETKYNFLHAVPATENLKGEEMNMQMDYFKSCRYLPRAVEKVRELYDFILIDTLPSFSLLFVNSLAACDYVLIPVKLEFLSMQGISLLQTKIRDVRDNIKPVELMGIVGTFHRRGVKESETCLQELHEKLSEFSFNTVVHMNSKLAESAAHSMPIQHYEMKSQGAQDYESLIEEVIDRCKQRKHAEAL